MSTTPTTLRRSPLFVAGVAILAVLAVVALVAPWIAPYDPQAITGGAFEEPSSDHLLGTNDAGSDIFSRLVLGSRTTIVVAVGATSLILLLGVAVGVSAALRGGFVDTALMRLVDIFLGLPMLPVLIFISALAGPSRGLSILMIGVFGWPETARIVRSQTLSLRRRGFVSSARAFGAGPFYVIRRHLLPALGPVIAANLVYVAGAAVTIEAGMAFIGLGDPSGVSWGAELNRALRSPQIYLGSTWLWWLMPAGLALTLTILGFTFVGVGLEPIFNRRANRVT